MSSVSNEPSITREMKRLRYVQEKTILIDRLIRVLRRKVDASLVCKFFFWRQLMSPESGNVAARIKSLNAVLGNKTHQKAVKRPHGT